MKKATIHQVFLMRATSMGKSGWDFRGFQVDAGFGWMVIFLAVFAFCEAVVVVH